MRLVIIATVFAAAFIGLAAAQPFPAAEPTLTVRGQGLARTAPDHAYATVDVVTKAPSADAATAAHRERAQRAAGVLRGMTSDGLTIEQSTFRLDEVRPPPAPNQSRSNSEYHAVTTFELKMTRLDAVDKAVTALASTGLFEVRNMRFGIEERNAGMATARKNAVDDARQRAETFAQAAGVRLGDILRIDDTESRSPREFAVSAPLTRSVQVMPPETLTLSASVTITWRIAPAR